MDNREKYAIIVSLHDDITEIIQLANSLNYTVINTFIQHRQLPDVVSYIGFGKVEEIHTYIENLTQAIDVIIIDGELKPSQWFILEKEWNVKVYDRIRLILEIFKDRADRKEARLQVRLAEFEYEKPFVKELIHRTREGEHPGLMAGGEYQVDDYLEMINKKAKNIRNTLQKIADNRSLQRQHRHRGGFYLVSLAGYTNAGKSSLLNYLSDETVTVENRLFSTLSTTTRRIATNHIPVLLTDTVGFIQRLPSWIIDAFHSTLEEIQQADIVLLILDGSDAIEALLNKLQTSLKELRDLNVSSPILIVINKIDLITQEELDARYKALNYVKEVTTQRLVAISIKKNKNIDLLIHKIYQTLPQLTRLRCVIPNTGETQSFISWLHEKTHIISISYNTKVDILIECNPKIREKIVFDCMSLNGNATEL